MRLGYSSVVGHKLSKHEALASNLGSTHIRGTVPAMDKVLTDRALDSPRSYWRKENSPELKGKDEIPIKISVRNKS